MPRNSFVLELSRGWTDPFFPGLLHDPVKAALPLGACAINGSFLDWVLSLGRSWGCPRISGLALVVGYMVAASLTLGLVRRLAFPMGSLPWLLLLLAAPCLGLLLLESLTFFWSCSLPIGRTSRRGVP